MYKTRQEYIQALNDSGLKPGDRVEIGRCPTKKDGEAVIFSGENSWVYFYPCMRIEQSNGITYTIHSISDIGLIHLDQPYFRYNIPFFLLKGYDYDDNGKLASLSKSKYLEFDKYVSKLQRELV